MKYLLALSFALILGSCAYDTTLGLEYGTAEGAHYGGTVKLQHTPK